MGSSPSTAYMSSGQPAQNRQRNSRDGNRRYSNPVPYATTVYPGYPTGVTSTPHQLPPYPIPNVVYPQPHPQPVWPSAPQVPYNQVPYPNLRRTYSWSETRDMAYSRILSAEEFLTRMQEHDTMVQAASRMEQRQNYVPAITKMLGLRGHLYGELVRIQTMLAEDDPQMKCIAEFEISNAEVVQKLREIRDESERLKRDASSNTDPSSIILGPGGSSSSTSTAAGQTSTRPSSSSSLSGRRGTAAAAATQSDAAVTTGWNGGGTSTSCGAGDDDEMGVGVDISTMTEEELKAKHNQEESRVAEKFARVIASNELSMDQVNRVLSDHARSVQLLKMRQEEEKRKVREKLEEKRKARRAADGKVDSLTSSENDVITNGSHTPPQCEVVIVPPPQSPIGGTTDLNEAVRRLEEMRLNGELTADAVANMMGQYLPRTASSNSVATNGLQVPLSEQRHRGSSPQLDENEMRESVNMMVQDNNRKKEEIQLKRRQEKELMDEKLKQKLKEKSHQHQLQQQQQH